MKRKMGVQIVGAVLLSAISSLGCSPGPYEENGEQQTGPGTKYQTIATSISNGKSVIFQSYRSDIQTHLAEVQSGQHNKIVETALESGDDFWNYIELPSSLLPSESGAVSKIDLSKQQGIDLKLRIINPAFGYMVNNGKTIPGKNYKGTFSCSSGTPQVTGILEISGNSVVSSVKQVSYPGNGYYGFTLYLKYSGVYPYPNGTSGDTIVRMGSLFQLVKSEN